MTAIVKGCFKLSDIPDPKLGPRKVDIAEAYCTSAIGPIHRQARPAHLPHQGLSVSLFSRFFGAEVLELDRGSGRRIAVVRGSGA